MCLMAWSWQPGHAQTLLLAANRDEWLDRPTLPMRWWQPDPQLPVLVLSGRDSRSGGIWLGLSDTGRFAAVTNVRDPGRERPQAPSRGLLPLRYLLGVDPRGEHAMPNRGPGAYAEAVMQDAQNYAGFNLLLGDAACGQLVWLSNHPQALREVEPGLHGLSNAALDTPWPKVVGMKTALAQQVSRELPDQFEALRGALLHDRSAADAALPSTGVSLERERALSASFIRMPGYGTRSSTLLRMEQDGGVHVRELQHQPMPAAPVDFVWNWRARQAHRERLRGAGSGGLPHVDAMR